MCRPPFARRNVSEFLQDFLDSRLKLISPDCYCVLFFPEHFGDFAIAGNFSGSGDVLRNGIENCAVDWVETYELVGSHGHQVPHFESLSRVVRRFGGPSILKMTDIFVLPFGVRSLNTLHGNCDLVTKIPLPGVIC